MQPSRKLWYSREDKNIALKKLKKVEKVAAMDMCFDNESSIVLGIMFILSSLLCRYGAAEK